MTISEYHELEAQSSTQLSKFYISQDHALMKTEPKSCLELGKIFETLFESNVKNNWEPFEDKYFIAENENLGNMPEKITEIVENENPLDLIVYKKDGTENLQKKNWNNWCKACNENLGKFPISNEIYDIAKIQVENTLKIDLFDNGVTLYEYLQNAKFQVPMIWEIDGIKKKALYDILCPIKINNEVKMFHFDLKNMANFAKFRKDYVYKYFIQDMHYSEGLVQNGIDCIDSMIFIVSTKEEPYLARPFKINCENIIETYEEYKQLTLDYDAWVKQGKPAKGFKPMQYINRRRYL